MLTMTMEPSITGMRRRHFSSPSMKQNYTSNFYPHTINMLDVPYDLAQVFDQQLVRLDHQALRRFELDCPRRHPVVANVINQMGKLSSEAQGIKRGQLTSYDKLVEAENEFALYLLWQPHPTKPGHSVVIGLLKVGYKQLYLYDRQQECHCVRPLCVMDFYVYETLQRQGHGHRMFDYMLQCEKDTAPEQCAIDKPSASLLSFMHKHYGLADPIWQITHYVVYPEFFEKLKNPNYVRPRLPAAPPLVQNVPPSDALPNEAVQRNIANYGAAELSSPVSTDSLNVTSVKLRRGQDDDETLSTMSVDSQDIHAEARQRKYESWGHQRIW